MPHPKRPNPTAPFPPGSALGVLAERTQLDFELEFYGALLAAAPDFADVLRAQACNLTMKGRMQDGLAIDTQLVQVRPHDPTAHYNLACRYAILKQRDQALTPSARRSSWATATSSSCSRTTTSTRSARTRGSASW
jgi:hypothetical protein